ncbi:MAG: hypothetical protein ABIQ93_05645, partial [Saprospiraceae bacterium]
MRNYFFLGLALVCLAQNDVLGQRLSFHHLSTDDGLSESVNKFMRRDKLGYMWLSSTEGLDRFDGIRVREYNESRGGGPPIRGNNVLSAVYEDAGHNLWFATDKAINRYNRATDDFNHALIAGDSTEQYRPFFLDPDGFLWVDLGPKGVFRLTTHADMTTPAADWQYPAGTVRGAEYFPVADLQTGRLKRLYTIYPDSAGLFEYAVTDNRLRATQRLLMTVPGTQEPLDLQCMLVSSDGVIWAGTQLGLVSLRLKGGQTELWSSLQGVDLTQINALVEISPNELGIATHDKGLLICNIGNQRITQFLHRESDRYSIASNRIENIYFDAEQRTLWVSIWGQGVDYAAFGKAKFDFIRLPNRSGQPDDANFMPSVLAPHENTGVWCASPLSGGLRLLDLKGQLVEDYSDQTGSVYDVLTSAQGVSFFCSDEGLLFKKRGNTQLLPIRDDRQTIWPFRLFESRSGQLWAMAQGLYQILPAAGGYLARRLPASPLDTMMLSNLYEDANGRGYGESDKDGLVIFEGPVAGGRILKTDPKVRVIKCFTENSNAVWAVGAFGVLQIDKQTLETKLFNDREGLPTKVIYSVLPVGDEAIWMGTNRGLVRYEVRGNHFDTFEMADGLQSKEYNTGSCLIAPDGRYWFGGIRGLNIFEADNIPLVATPPKIQITDLNINDLPYVHSDWFAKHKRNPCELVEMSLEHDENTLTFYLAALEYADPKSNKV